MAISVTTIKLLFARSGNRCAFPSCSQELVVGDTVVGEVCHIKAASKGGPRHDPSQTDQERSGYDNLILMCPTHHKIIDSDLMTYPVDRLIELKSNHAANSTTQYEISDERAEKLAAQASITLIGSIVAEVVSVNQSGGQTARTINNYGPPRRSISTNTRNRMLAILRPSPNSIDFASTYGDTEAHAYKRELMGVFRQAGWTVNDMNTFMFFDEKTGLVVTIPVGASEIGPSQVAMQALSEAGGPIRRNRGDMANRSGIYVQVWRAPQA